MSTAKPPRNLECWNCGQSLDEIPRPISRHQHCPRCFEGLHCCRLCAYYRPDAAPYCDEDRADPPVNKENANFCEWYKPATGVFREARSDKSSAAQSRLNAMFDEADEARAPAEGNSASTGDPEPALRDAAVDQARTRLDSLFSKD